MSLRAPTMLAGFKFNHLPWIFTTWDSAARFHVSADMNKYTLREVDFFFASSIFAILFKSVILLQLH